MVATGVAGSVGLSPASAVSDGATSTAPETTPIGVIGPGASMEPVPTEPTVMSATKPSTTGRTSRAPRER